jgi:type IV pilus assembly protein PilW
MTFCIARTNRLKKRHQAGFSLIELLIAMAMGIALLAVVILSYQNISGGNRLGTAQQQMNEDAQAAFQILGQQIRTAGYNPLQPATSAPDRNILSPTPLAGGEVEMGIFACKNGFTNGEGASAATQMSALTCSTTAGTASLAIQYEADAFSPNVSGSTPADCRGTGVAALSQQLTNSSGGAAGTRSYSLVENRYFIANGGLSCTGNGGGSAFTSQTQPLVGNIENMEIQFGLVNPTAAASTATATVANAQFVSGYLGADKIGAATGAAAGTEDAALAGLTGSRRWALVRTVRICLTVKSSARVLVDALGTSGGNTVYGYYAGCNPVDSTQQTITDRYLRKSYVMHFALRNRITLPV